MSPKSVSLMVLALVALLACPVVASLPAADAEAASEYYREQLDANGRGLYDHVSQVLDGAAEDPTDSVTVTYTMTSVPSTQEEAVEYARAVVSDTLAALYLSDPSHIWLWDYPVAGVTVETPSYDPEEDTIIATFVLTVPERYADDPETEENEVAEAIAALAEAVEGFEWDPEGDLESVASAINDLLRGVTVEEDEEGTISSPLDAFSGTSSSAGVAAAFTILCRASGVEGLTVKGYAPSEDSEDGLSTVYWNVVCEDGAWYAVDCTLNGDDAENCLLAGAMTQMTVSGVTERFGGIRYADLDMATSNSLEAPTVTATGVEWPEEEPSLLESYGMYVFLALICVIIVGVMVHALRSGNI